jgi:heat shock transcription factor
MGSVTELFDASPSDTTSSTYIKKELQTNPQEGMMKLIHNTNAGNSSGIDLPEMAANTSARISNDQRTKMLSIMAGQTSAASPSIPAPASANMTSSMPPSSMSASLNTKTSLSPILSPMPPPSLHDIQLTQTEIEALQRMQEEQASKLDELSSLLGPLSPSGRIPGLDDSANPGTSYFGDNVDINEFLDPGAFNDLNYTGADLPGGNVTGPTDGNDFNFALDSTNDFGTGAGGSGNDDVYQNGHAGETDSANNTPSPVATEDIHQNDFDGLERDAKRRRKG